MNVCFCYGLILVWVHNEISIIAHTFSVECTQIDDNNNVDIDIKMLLEFENVLFFI